jgi:putative hydrolase of HD superfamily
MASSSHGVRNLFNFFWLCGKLKHLKRTGWVNHNVSEPETVSGHMYRMAMMSFLFGNKSNPSVDRDRCIRMALVHDLAESIVGDLTPSSGVSKEEKYAREKAAMEQIQTYLPQEVGKDMYDLWLEYETGQTAEARVVKDLDKFDMIFQAFEYEKAESREGELQQFFDSTKGI